MTSNENWYVLRVKPHKDRTVNERLHGWDIQTYMPLVRVKPKNPRAAKYKPYFPGYLFIYADLEVVGTNTLNWMPGGMGLVSFDGAPATVPENLINELKKRLAQIEAAGGLTMVDLKPGDKVRIVEGPLSGYEAIFDMRLPGKERVQVLLSFLSQYPQPVELDAGDIKKIGK
jgi:transcription antitermination factor NusG